MNFVFVVLCRKEYYEVPYAEMRCMVEPKFAERSIIKHSEYLKKSRVVMSAAKSVSASEVVTESGERVLYDYLVISTGSTYTGPSTKDERVKLYEAGKCRMPSQFLYFPPNMWMAFLN